MKPALGYRTTMTLPDYQKLMTECYNSGEAQAALKRLTEFRSEILLDWKSLARLYAPSGQEHLRAEYLVNRFKALGIDNAVVDRCGNAVAFVGNGRPSMAFLGTMDDLATVADMVRTWDKPISEEGGRLIGPGTNSSATCATVTGLARLLTLPQVRLKGRVWLVGVVQEETGLTGVKGFLDDHSGEVDYVVDAMGGLGRISYGALGIHWFKIHFKGQRAHTLSGRRPSVTRAVARAVEKVFSIPLAEEPDRKTFLNVTMLGAGKVYNHSSDDGWFSVDLRSMDNEVLSAVKKRVYEVAGEAAEESELEWWVEPFSEVPAGQIPGIRESPLVRFAEEGMKLLGVQPVLSNRGSSNFNAAIARGIPAVSLGGDRGGGRDTLQEYANIEPIMKGIQLHFLLAIALTS